MQPNHLHQLPKYERPRERLANVGPTNLTNVELLALILGSGTKRYPVMLLANQIMHTFDTRKLLTATLDQLAEIPGVGTVQAGKLVAALELGKRLLSTQASHQLLSAEDAVREVQDIRHKNREHLIALYLNARHEVIHKEVLTIGSLNVNSLEPRDVFAPAFAHPCYGIILAHNHPSGDATPSQADRQMTQDLRQAGQLLGIKIIDHLVVTGHAWSSILAPPPAAKAQS